MPMDSDGPSLRGQKEQIDGLTVDAQGVHLDENLIKEALNKVATSGVDSIGGKDDGPDIQGETETIDGKIIDKQGFHLNKDELLSSIASSIGLKSSNIANKGKASSKSASLDLGMYQPVWEELQQIPFSDNCEQEMHIIAKAVKEAARDLKIKRIIANTQAVAKNAQKFYYSNDGMRVIFSILGNRFSMAAKGDFTGMEAFYIQVNGDSLDGIVLRKDESGNYKDITANYKIEIKRAQ